VQGYRGLVSGEAIVVKGGARRDQEKRRDGGGTLMPREGKEASSFDKTQRGFQASTALKKKKHGGGEKIEIDTNEGAVKSGAVVWKVPAKRRWWEAVTKRSPGQRGRGR